MQDFTAKIKLNRKSSINWIGFILLLVKYSISKVNFAVKCIFDFTENEEYLEKKIGNRLKYFICLGEGEKFLGIDEPYQLFMN